MLLIVAALAPVWEDGLAAGGVLLLAGYTIALASSSSSLDPVAPLYAAGLAACVDLGAWSLELRDRPERQPSAHLRTLGLLAVGALATSALVLAAGSLRPGGGTALVVLGAAAAVALLALIALPGRTDGRT